MALRRYHVTVTPKVLSYAGSYTFGAYTVVVEALSAAKAISKARKDRRDEEGRHVPAATFQARRDTEGDG